MPKIQIVISAGIRYSVGDRISAPGACAAGKRVFRKEEGFVIHKKLSIKTKKQGAVINKEIYGHFSEHLGRCIYNGLFVSKDSPIPNHEGMRDDVVTALRDMGIPVLRWPGG